MPTGLEQHDDDAMSEILRRAIRKDEGGGKALRERLLAAADELGISQESVLKAEAEYRQDTERSREIAAYEGHLRGGLKTHLATYVAVNLFLIALNIYTFHQDRQIWSVIPLLGWGVGIVIHAVYATRKPDWFDEEFQEWRKARIEAADGPTD